MHLEIYGWNDRFRSLASPYEGLTAGRIISQERGGYRVVTEVGETPARVSGKFRYDTVAVSDYPAVGDFVMLKPGSYDGDAVIRHVLPRKSCFIRRAAGHSRQEQVVAANIDTVFLCMSLNNDYNLRRLERYLSIAWDSGAVPVIVLTKADLCDDCEDKIRELEAVAVGVDIIITSARESSGCDAINPFLAEGKTVAFIGSSGVGKSTLINGLLGEERLKVGNLRNDDKGHHTTTHRELILLPRGGLVIDTPGMRELGMWDSSDGIDRTFSDLEELAACCRFRDCTHASEPGCAIQTALRDGNLSPARFQSWQKLRAESAYAQDSDSYLAAKNRRFKEIAKYNKANHKR